MSASILLVYAAVVSSFERSVEKLRACDEQDGEGLKLRGISWIGLLAAMSWRRGGRGVSS